MVCSERGALEGSSLRIVQQRCSRLRWTFEYVLPCSSDGFTHLQDLKHDGQTQFERLKLTQQILHLSLLEAPFGPLRYSDGLNIALVVPTLRQIDHVLDLIEYHLALVPDLRRGVYRAL